MSWAIVAGAVVSAVAAAATTTIQVQQAKANQRTTEMQLEYQRQVAEQNAKLENQQAQDAVRRGDIEASRKMAQIRQFKGTQTSILAAHGLDLSDGTPADVLAGTDWAGATDLQTVMHNSALEAWGHKVQAQNFQTDAANLEWQKTATRQATKNQIQGSIFSGIMAGASSVGGALANYNKGQQGYPPKGGTDSGAGTMLTGAVNIDPNSFYGRRWQWQNFQAGN